MWEAQLLRWCLTSCKIGAPVSALDEAVCEVCELLLKYIFSFMQKILSVSLVMCQPNSHTPQTQITRVANAYSNSKYALVQHNG